MSQHSESNDAPCNESRRVNMFRDIICQTCFCAILLNKNMEFRYDQESWLSSRKSNYNHSDDSVGPYDLLIFALHFWRLMIR